MSRDWTEAFFDDRYMEERSPYFTEAQDRADAEFIRDHARLEPGERVLDLACGYGRHAVALGRLGLGPVVGLDFNESYVAAAREAAATASLDQVSFVRGDMLALDYEAEFDLVYNFENSMFYWDDATHLDILRRVRRALKPGGRLLIETWNREGYVHKEFRDRLYPVRRAVRRGFELAQIVRARLRGQPIWQPESHLDLISGRLNHEFRFPTADGGFETKEAHVRIHALSELRMLLELAGFAIERTWGAIDGSPYAPESPLMIALARPAEPMDAGGAQE